MRAAGVTSQNSNRLQQSTGKASVIYNEFKYNSGNSTVKYTTTNQTGETVQNQGVSEFTVPQTHNGIEMVMSPKTHCFKLNKLDKQREKQARAAIVGDSSSVLQIQQIGDSESPCIFSPALSGKMIEQITSQDQNIYEERISALQDKIHILEGQLKESKARNSDIEDMVKGKRRS